MESKPQREVLQTRVPPPLAEAVEARAKANRRSVAGEMEVLLSYACAHMPVQPVHNPEER